MINKAQLNNKEFLDNIRVKLSLKIISFSYLVYAENSKSIYNVFKNNIDEAHNGNILNKIHRIILELKKINWANDEQIGSSRIG